MKEYRQSKFNIKSMESYGLYDLDVVLSDISDIYVYLDEEHRDSLKKDLRHFYYGAEYEQFYDSLLYHKDMVAKMIQEQYNKQKSKNINARKNMKEYRQAFPKKEIRAGNDENIILIKDTLNCMNELIRLLSEKNKELDIPMMAVHEAWMKSINNNRHRKILVHCASFLAALAEELSNFTKNLSVGNAGKLYDLIQKELEEEQQN